jgi:hypothetical protein
MMQKAVAILKLVATTLIALAFAVSITRGESLYAGASSVLVTFAGIEHWVAGSPAPQPGK